MPNHIANKLVITGDKDILGRLVSSIETPHEDNGEILHIDFNKIIPMPEELTTTECSSKAIESLALYLHLNNKADLIPQLCRFVRIENVSGSPDFDERYMMGKKLYELYASIGYTNWYDWRLANWNTKWNAYDTYIEEYEPTRLELYFNTAWSSPLPVIEKLVSMFPELQFNYVFADEDFSYNTGMGASEEGCLNMYYPEGGSDEAVALYIESHQCEKNDFYKDENGKWHNRNWEDDYEEEENEE